MKVVFFEKLYSLQFYAKILHHNIISGIYENSESVFYLFRANENLEICMFFDLAIERIKAVMRYFC